MRTRQIRDVILLDKVIQDLARVLEVPYIDALRKIDLHKSYIDLLNRAFKEKYILPMNYFER